MTRLTLLAAVVFGFMLVEALRASSNERAQRAAGGIEPRQDVYPVMRVAYPGVVAAMIAEGLFRGTPSPVIILAGTVIYTAGKLLKWWAILTLGRFWTFRIIVVPGTTMIASGPYRYLRHPNYVGVAGEFVGAALVAAAPVSGTLGTLIFVGLMAARVRIENRALDAILRRG
jgi:methyltransferase